MIFPSQAQNVKLNEFVSCPGKFLAVLPVFAALDKNYGGRAYGWESLEFTSPRSHAIRMRATYNICN